MTVINEVRLGRVDRDVIEIIDAWDGPCPLAVLVQNMDWDPEKVLRALNRLEKYGVLVRSYERTDDTTNERGKL